MSEPYARDHHFAWSFKEKIFVWGGESGRAAFDPRGLEEYDSYSESWTRRICRGKHPRGYCRGAFASHNDRLFSYGGSDGGDDGDDVPRYCGGLGELNITNLEWTELSPESAANGPMKKENARMVHFGDHKLAVIGGFGIPNGPAQPGSTFVKREMHLVDDGQGWTDEFHVFDLIKREWSSPVLSGTRPPPCSLFTLTSIDRDRAVLFAGWQPGGRVNDTYLLDFSKMECTKLNVGELQPPARAAHAACCVYMSGRPMVLISGGFDSSFKTLGDAWLLDVYGLDWTEVPTEGDEWKRRGHTLTSHSLGPDVTEVVMFGGLSATNSKLAGTTTRLFGQDSFSGLTPRANLLHVLDMLLDRADNEQTESPINSSKEADSPASSAKPAVPVSSCKEPGTTTAAVIPFEDLELKEHIGEGTFGVVRKGYWTSSDGRKRLVAVKQLKGVDKNEVRILSTLDHPNIITLYGTSEYNGLLYIVTDYAENGSLQDFISKQLCTPDLKRTLPWAKQVADAMLYLHHRGIIHRDLKSNNVVLTSKWMAKVCDLGTARALEHTTKVTAVGTFAWIAPEIMMMQPASKMCDVYSYGILLWELATHDVPFKGVPPLFIPREVDKGVRPPLPESTDVALKELIQSCWQTKPEDRPVFESILYSLEECEMGKMECGELEFVERVGEGGFGVVFKGFWKTKRAGKLLVAIKNLTAGHEKEVKVLSSLRHPNFIHFYGCVKSQYHISLVTEFAENGCVAGYIKARKGKPEKERALKWAKEIADGMRYLHERGYAHRDLKSSNVVLVSDWTAKICDMGTTRILKSTIKQTLTGTYPWIAPEILREEPASKKCDVYSYAIVLWELATFQVPFEGVGDMMILMQVADGERPPIPSDCDQFFSDLIKRCWVDNYKERPAFDEIMEVWQQY